MTHPRRLVLAMILLVVGVSCVASAVTYYLAIGAAPGAPFAAVAGALAVVAAAGLVKLRRGPLPDRPRVRKECKARDIDLD